MFRELREFAPFPLLRALDFSCELGQRGVADEARRRADHAEVALEQPPRCGIGRTHAYFDLDATSIGGHRFGWPPHDTNRPCDFDEAALHEIRERLGSVDVHEWDRWPPDPADGANGHFVGRIIGEYLEAGRGARRHQVVGAHVQCASLPVKRSGSVRSANSIRTHGMRAGSRCRACCRTRAAGAATST
jgi:hypothetical protein